MKILCIAKNYPDHAVEMAKASDARVDSEAAAQVAAPQTQNRPEPVFFLKPDSALLQKNMPFFYPDFSQDVNYELEVVVRIDKVGKSIEERFAHKYYSEVALGIDFTARDIQKKAKEAGRPWALSKGFDGSAVLSDFVSLADLGKTIDNLDFHLLHNGEKVQVGNTSQMIHSVNRQIAYVSQFMTLKTGDLIYTGTPSGVGPVKIGDTLEGVLEGRKLLECRIK